MVSYTTNLERWTFNIIKEDMKVGREGGSLG
jgi:hypothetical protein